MRTWYSTSSLKGDAPTYISSQASTALQHCDYLSNLNYKLVNQVNDAETEKFFYKNKLNNQYRNHTSQLQETFTIISQKNNTILCLEENIDRLKKDYRVLSDSHSCLKADNLREKEFFEKEMQNMKFKCEKKIKDMEEELQKSYQLKLSKRVQEVKDECEERVKMYKGQLEQLTQNSNQLTHELKLMQDQYRQMLLKNDTIIQQSINRQLRKRDYQAQNNYLRDVSQYQSVLKDKKQLKQQLQSAQDKINNLRRRINQLQAQNQVQKAKYKDLSEAFTYQKQQNKQYIEEKYRETTQADVNTEQPYVPVVMPVDMDLMSQIVSLKEFVVQKIIQRFLQFFCKMAVTDPKKKKFSLMTFKNGLQQLKIGNPQNKILLFFHSSLQRIIKTYCPTLTYSKEYLTVKDQFIKRTLMECQTITNPSQRLYRILQLVHRLRHPITHVNSEISPGQLRMVEIKLMVQLKKCMN